MKKMEYQVTRKIELLFDQELDFIISLSKNK